MTDLSSIRNHLEEIVGAYEADHTVYRYPDGTMGIDRGSTRAYLRIVDGSPVLVHVEATVLDGVESSPELLGILNGLNVRARFARAYWAESRITLATELIAGLITGPELDYSIRTLAELADLIDDDLQRRFGGRRGTEIS